MSLLSNKPFRNLWLGQAISQLGDSFYYVIFAFMVLKISGSAAMVGFTSALEFLPYLLCAPYAGVLADRMDRRRIMLLSDFISAAVLVLFALLLLTDATPPVWTLMLTACCLSTIRVFFLPAKSASIPALVGPAQVMQANAFSMATQNTMPLISLSLSATVVAAIYAVSPQWFFITAVLLNTLSFLGSAVFIAKLPKIMPDRERAEEAHPLQDMKEGIAFIRGRRDLGMLLALQLVLNLTISPFFVVYLVANERWFGGKPSNLAWFEFCFFAGMVLSSLVVGKLNVKRVGLSCVIGVVGVGVCVAVMGFTPDFWLFVLWNLMAGLLLPFAHIPVSTYLQVTVADSFRGRVNSAWQMASIGVQPVGMALGGVLVQTLGLVGGFLAMGVGMCSAGTIGLFDRRFRGMRLPEAEQVELPPPPAEERRDEAC